MFVIIKENSDLTFKKKFFWRIFFHKNRIFTWTIRLSWLGLNNPHIPDPVLEVPSAMFPLSMMTTSDQPFWKKRIKFKDKI